MASFYSCNKPSNQRFTLCSRVVGWPTVSGEKYILGMAVDPIFYGATLRDRFVAAAGAQPQAPVVLAETNEADDHPSLCR